MAGKSNRITWTLAPIAALGALALMALPGNASAKSLGTWKVTDGSLDQNVQWQTDSQGDDGCYTNVWKDSGDSSTNYAPVTGQKVTLQKKSGLALYSFVKGNPPLKFKGTDRQMSHYDVTPHRDQRGDQCGPPTAKPPNTSGCGTRTVRSMAISLVAGEDGIEPFGAISDPSLFDENCPSDDALSVAAVGAPWEGSMKEFTRQKKVEIHGHRTDSSAGWVEGPGYEDINESQSATIHWDLTFKKVRARHRHHHQH